MWVTETTSETGDVAGAPRDRSWRARPCPAWTWRSSGMACGCAAWVRITFPIPTCSARCRQPSRIGSAGRGRRGSISRDAEDYWFHLYKPRAGDTIVDIGAGRGEDVFAFSRAVGPGGRVWAIEPHPVSFAALRRLCEAQPADECDGTELCVHGRRPGELQIETLPVWESNYVRTGDPSPASYPVKGVRFDDLAAEHGIDAHRLPEDEHRRRRAVGAARLRRGAAPRAICVHRGARLSRGPRRRRGIPHARFRERVRWRRRASRS